MENDLLDTFKTSGLTVDEEVETSEERAKKFKESVQYLSMNAESEKDLRKRAVRLGLIPPQYENAEFSADMVRANITKQQNKSGHKFKVQRSKDYFDTVNEIITAIRSKHLPKRSYLIGAPSNFGKQSFATDCILASLYNGWLTVPYISLTELAEIKIQNDKVIMGGLTGVEEKLVTDVFTYDYGYDDPESLDYAYSYIDSSKSFIKQPITITGRYSWSEYINAPVLVCFLSGLENKVVESHILYSLLSIRSAKGFPTIVMISTSLVPYERDPILGKHIWHEIKSYDESDCTYSRVYHVSCYKQYDSFSFN